MNFLQALAYFLWEAALGLVRSWRISLVAVTTIAVSLSVAGSFLLLSSNLARQVERWQAETKVVIYLDSEVDEQLRAELRELANAPGWVVDVRELGSREARERFQDMFPSLAGLLDGFGEEPLPPSVEVSLDVARAQPRQDYELWIEELWEAPQVVMVDDDRDWLSQLQTLLALVRWVGLALAGLLLGGAVLTIAGVIRLTLFLHRDEISVLRLVGATEFLIRGPFYVAGMLQGLLGGVLAVGGVFVAFLLIEGSARVPVLLVSIIADFLSSAQVALLLATGLLAGLLGTILSLRRETVGD